MTKWPKLDIALLVSVPFAEVAFNIFAVKALGPALTYSLFAIPTLAGLAFHWRVWQQHVKPIYAEMKAVRISSKDFIKDEVYLQMFWAVTTFQISLLLVLIPGFLTDIAAFFLMLRYFPRERPQVQFKLQHTDATTIVGNKIVWKKALSMALWLSIPFVEFGIILLLVGLCGAATTVTMYFVPTALGLTVLWFRRRAAMPPKAPSDAFSDANPGVELSDQEKVELNYTPEYIDARCRLFCYVTTGYLMFFPGFLTTVVAFTLMIPPVRNLMHSYFRRIMLRSKPKTE